MHRTVITLVVSALVLAGCGDGEPPDLSDITSATPTRSLSASDRPEQPTESGSVAPTRGSAEPTTSKPEPTKSTAEPTTSKPEPTKSTAEPTTSKPEPTKSTAEPTTSEASPTPSPTDSTEPTAQTTEAWPWLLLLLALVVAGVAIWWFMGRRRRSADWWAGYSTATTKAGWLVEQPVNAVLGAPSVEAMGQAWVELSTAISDVDEQLYGLSDTAPEEVARQRLAATRAALDHLRAALVTLVEEARAVAGTGEQRQQIARVEQARAALRQALTTQDGTT